MPVADCDTSISDLQGADIRYDTNVIALTNFLNEKVFSCFKCQGQKIPVATVFHDTTNKAFYFKKYDKTTFDLSTVNEEGESVVCRDPAASDQFGLAAGDASFDLDANCSLALIDLSQTLSASTKAEDR